MSAKDITRARDDLILSVLGMYRDGFPNHTIAARMNLPAPQVSTLRARVMADDLKFSGECMRDVLKGYSA